MNKMRNYQSLSLEAFRSLAEVSVIFLDVRIVYDKSHFTATSADEFLTLQIQDMADVFGQIKISFNVEFTEGKATDKATNGDYSRIATGAKDGIINAYLYYDNNSHYDISWFNPHSQQIFIRKSAHYKTRGLGKESLSHEMAHLLGVRGNLTANAVRIFGAEGNYWIVRKVKEVIYLIVNTVDNITSDVVLGTANTWLRKGWAVYGRDWVDDYRQIIDTVSVNRKFASKDSDYPTHNPTILDIYRVGAMNIAAQKK